MKIGLDLDNTINENSTTIAFFSFITHAMQSNWEIFIITHRSDDCRDETTAELANLGIYYDHLIITANKADFIIKNGISVFFDDTDETFQSLPESVLVFKTREAGNFDFDKHKWVYGNKTGINIDERK